MSDSSGAECPAGRVGRAVPLTHGALAQALFADAPVDSDTFMTYVHQNYPPFCNEINECADLVEYLSSSDSLLRMEGDTVGFFVGP